MSTCCVLGSLFQGSGFALDVCSLRSYSMGIQDITLREPSMLEED